jgi:NAD(P)H-hydrate epimerase
VPGIELMRRAGRATFDALLHRFPGITSITVAAGKGNNAGDGYVIAELALAQGLAVELIQIGDAAELAGDAAIARDSALEAGVIGRRTDDGAAEPTGEVIVDALLGTGISGPPRPPYAALIERINAAGVPVVAVDTPSGVEADTGAAPGAAVRADLTVTFIGRKIGLHTGEGAACAGQVRFADLGVGDDIRRSVSGLDWLNFDAVLGRYPLPVRTPAAYKQALGHLVVIGGDTSMGGAPLMAAEAALRTGAGMVTVITRGTHRGAILSRRPELMVADADDAELRASVLGRASQLVVGPGIGRGDWGRQLLAEAVASGLPMVVDADGLHLLAELAPPAAPVVVTPHTGEAAVLLGTDSAAVNANRIDAARRLADRVGGVAILKGAGSVIASALEGEARCLGICAHGNPGMATAGMGDVLAGIVGGLLCQGMAPEAGAVTGMCLHSLAADRAASKIGQMSLVATDVLEPMMDILRTRGESADG